MEEEAATVSKLIKGLATLEKVKEKVKEEDALSMIGGKSETGSPYLRIWGSSRSLDALNHTPLVEMVVVPDVFMVHQPHSPSMDLVRFRKDRTYRECLLALKTEFIRQLERETGRIFYNETETKDIVNV